ncbi:hypothetical protein Salat_0070300 [Sesamum alatum]|uniref:Reverse transcriptase zinc-binding domain-containing protein n=1 Tax=Sesamum alatum TaxID=300844 RepID=A0AAE1YW38_9LAMI|nr:hypothetical protein Salat_0070300 [Sesamum alatum]
MRVKFFVWKAANNAIPTVLNWQHRRIQDDASCPACNCGTEDVKHALWSYPNARLIWALSNIPWSVIDCLEEDLEGWLREIAKQTEPHFFGWLLMIIWCIWNCRNSKLMEGVEMDRQRLIQQTLFQYNAFTEANKKNSESIPRSRWRVGLNRRKEPSKSTSTELLAVAKVLESEQLLEITMEPSLTGW